MEFQNAVRKLSTDWQSRSMLPSEKEKADLRPGNYVRLQTDGGSFLWARVLRRYDKRLILVADDSLPSGELSRGQEVETTLGCVFHIV
jgi:hypothetical protein